MVLILTSRFSNDTSAWRGRSPNERAAGCESVLMTCKNLPEFRVAERKQGLALQIPGEKSKPNAHECDGDNEVEPNQPAVRQVRPGEPEEVDQAHEDQPASELRNQSRIALEAAGEQQKKRHEKMEDDNGKGERAPAAGQTGAIKGNLLRQIAGPNDQQLGEIEVRPEQQEGKEQLAKVMKDARIQDARVRLGAREHNHDNNHESHGTDKLPGDVNEAVDRRSPMRLDRHDPINDGKADAEHIENNARAGEQLEAAAQRAVFATDILLTRPGVEGEHQDQPNGEIDGSTNIEVVEREVALLERGERLFGRGMQPRAIEILDAKRERKKKHEEKGKGSRG